MVNSLNEKQNEERTLPFMLVKACIYIILQVMSFLMIKIILLGEFSSSDGVGYRLSGGCAMLFLTGLSAVALASFFTRRKYVKPTLIAWLCLSPLFIYLMMYYPIISGFLVSFLWLGTVGTCICIRSNAFWQNWLIMLLINIM